MAALIAKTLVGEARRTWRAIAISTLIRRFNIWAVEIRRSREPDKKKKRLIKRVSGSLRVKLFSQFVDRFLSEVRMARAEFGDDKQKALAESVATKKTKRSAEEQQVVEDEFEACVKHALEQTYKAELEKGYDVTAIMGGKVFLRILTKGNKLEDVIDKEMIARNIPTEMEEFVRVYGNGNDRLKEVPIGGKKKLLKLDEAQRETKKNVKLNLEEALKKTNSIKPLSEAMEAVLERQQEILSKR